MRPVTKKRIDYREWKEKKDWEAAVEGGKAVIEMNLTLMNSLFEDSISMMNLTDGWIKRNMRKLRRTYPNEFVVVGLDGASQAAVHIDVIAHSSHVKELGSAMRTGRTLTFIKA